MNLAVLFPSLILSLSVPESSAEPVVLQVGVHQEAGSIFDVAADGAAGQCRPLPTRLICPAEQEVLFRWGPSGPWTLVGTTTLSPGQSGEAWVLMKEEERETERQRLQAPDVTAEEVRALFIPSRENKPPAPSWGMLQDLVDLLDHPSATVRLASSEALHRWMAGNSLLAMPNGSPMPIPHDTLMRMAQDKDKRVRRRALLIIEDLRSEEQESLEALRLLITDSNRGIQRKAMRVFAALAIESPTAALEAWDRAIAAVPTAGPRGRAAASTLAQLSKPLSRSDEIDPTEGVGLVVQHHPQRGWRVWKSWRKRVSFQRPWVDVLLAETAGLNQTLLRHWAKEDPEGLAEALAAWKPSAENSKRFRVAQKALRNTKHDGLREVLDLNSTE